MTEQVDPAGPFSLAIMPDDSGAIATRDEVTLEFTAREGVEVSLWATDWRGDEWNVLKPTEITVTVRGQAYREALADSLERAAQQIRAGAR